MSRWRNRQPAASTSASAANRSPTVLNALTVTSVGNALGTQNYAQAAAWNRIPLAGWVLMGVIAAAASWSIAYGARKVNRPLLFGFPLLISIAFFLIADLDSPRGGLIHIPPRNLNSVREALASQ